MIRHGVAPFLECSSRGDKRFSAFCAMVGGSSIEDQYQRCKVFDTPHGLVMYMPPGLAKGLGRLFRVKNMLQCRELYANRWDVYIKLNPDLLDVLRAASGLSDVFGKPHHACQATELWRIRNNGLTPEEQAAYLPERQIEAQPALL